MARATVEVRRIAAALGVAILVAVAFGLPVGVAAQTTSPTATPAAAQVSLTVIEIDGRLLPFEQFRAEVNDSCAPGGTPVPHLHTRTGGPAIAINRTPVPDPAPEGCGFGTLQAGAPGAAVVRLANVDPAEVQAWSALTGIPLTTAGAVPPEATSPLPGPATTPTAVPTVPVDAPTVTTGSVWSLLVVPLVLLAGVVGAYILAGKRSRPAPAPPRVRIDDYEPIDGGVVRERLTRGHAGLLALPAEPPPPPVLDEPEDDLDGDEHIDADDGWIEDVPREETERPDSRETRE